MYWSQNLRPRCAATTPNPSRCNSAMSRAQCQHKAKTQQHKANARPTQGESSANTQPTNDQYKTNTNVTQDLRRRCAARSPNRHPAIIKAHPHTSPTQGHRKPARDQHKANTRQTQTQTNTTPTKRQPHSGSRNVWPRCVAATPTSPPRTNEIRPNRANAGRRQPNTEPTRNEHKTNTRPTQGQHKTNTHTRTRTHAHTHAHTDAHTHTHTDTNTDTDTNTKRQTNKQNNTHTKTYQCTNVPQHARPRCAGTTETSSHCNSTRTPPTPPTQGQHDANAKPTQDQHKASTNRTRPTPMPCTIDGGNAWRRPRNRQPAPTTE